MEIHFGVIPDKQEIYNVLLQSQSMNQQLAVCHRSDGKLVVKICMVKQIISTENGISVTFESTEANQSDSTIPLAEIVSIYPIHDFIK